jgi:hypothetical protein
MILNVASPGGNVQEIIRIYHELISRALSFTFGFILYRKLTGDDQVTDHLFLNSRSPGL